MRQAVPRNVAPLVVESCDAQGWGEGRIDGQLVRAKGLLPGECAQVRPMRREGRAIIAQIVEVIDAAPDRVVPRCAHFAVCGGCAWQHLDADARLQRDTQAVAALLSEAGVDAPAPLAPILGPSYHYRRRARLSARYTQKGGRVFLGFREAASRQIADIDTCAILVEPFASALPSLRLAIESLSVRHAVPQVEVAAGDDRAAVVIRHLQPLTQADTRALRQWSANSGIDVWTQPGGPATATPLGSETPSWLHYRAGDDAPLMQFHPLDFVQINAAVNRQLVALVLDAVRDANARRVLDLFCGIGNFTLPMAQVASAVIGVESVPDLVQRAQQNAVANGLHKARFLTLDLHASGAQRLLGLGDFDTVLLDPPRSGIGATLAVLPRLAAAQLIYVSCNPVTFASDLAQLQASGQAGGQRGGYRLQSWRVLDMFPHTQHIECMGILTRTGAANAGVAPEGRE